MAKDTFYFSHDYNARNDSKIKKLLAKHSYEGYGIYWAIIEDLYNNANALPTDYDTIAYDLRTNSELIESIVNNFDLFIVEVKEFGSLSVQNRLNERNNKSVKARESANYRWGKIKKDANVMRTQCDSNAIKETKVNNKKVIFNFKNSLLNYGFEENLIDGWLVVRKKKKGVNTEIAFNGFIKEVEKSKVDKNEILKKCVEKSWSGFEVEWLEKEKFSKNGYSTHNKTHTRPGSPESQGREDFITS